MTKLLSFTALLCALTFGLMAADITGKWTSEQPGRNGGAARVTTYNLKADGSKLTGSVERPGRGGDPMKMDITDGKIDGNNVSFKVTMNMGGNDMTQEYKGTLDGDTLKLTVTGGRGPQEITAKRATT